MPVSAKAYTPWENDTLTKLVNDGWDTNRSRDATDGHDRSTLDEKLRTAICAFAASFESGQNKRPTDAVTCFGEALAMLIEIEQQCRKQTTRSKAVIVEMIDILKDTFTKGDLAAAGAMVAMLWTIGAIDSREFQTILKHGVREDEILTKGD